MISYFKKMFGAEVDNQQQESYLNSKNVIAALDNSLARIEFNLDGTVKEANNIFLEAMGYQRHEIIGKHHRMFCDPSYTKTAEYQQFWQDLNQGKHASGQIKRIKKSGQACWLEANYEPLTDENGNVVGVIKFAKDITDIFLKNNEQEARIDALNNSMLSIDFDLDGRILSVNSNFLSVTGYALNELVGEHYSKLYDNSDSTENDDKQFWQALKQGKMQTGQYKRLTKEGNVIWLESSYNPIVDPDGKTYKIVEYATDITESMFTREYSNQTLEQALDAVVAINPDNNITLFNKAAEKLWGYQREEVMGKNVKMLVPSAIRHDHDKLVNANRNSGINKIVGTSREVEIYRKDGALLWGKLSLSRLLINNEIHYTAFVQDVTEEVKRREEFKKLSLVANETGNSVIITSSEGKIQYVNPGFTRLTGYSTEESLGRKPGELLQGQHTDQNTVARIREKLAAREPFYEEILNYNKAGEPYWISLAVNPIFDKEGELQNFISIQANINDTKISALEFNYKLDAINRANAVAEFDLDGCIIAANENYVHMLDYENESQVLGITLKRALHPDMQTDGSYDHIWNKLSQGEFFSGDAKFQAKDGSIRWLNGSFNPIFSSSGMVTKYVMFGDDFTSRKQGIEAITATLIELENGNLTARANGEFDIQMNSLRDSLNTSLEKLQNTMMAILDVANNVTDGATEISKGNMDLSTRVESQAASLEETAATMEELTASARNNTENAESVNNRASETESAAQKGKTVVDSAVNAMSEISSSSKKIADIISVIDEIAFQTNLLALNAAVEAARAGEQGRGFAVVAGEVRNLAQRSAEAAKEIGSLISDSVSKVSEGTELVNTSGNMLDTIIQQVMEVTKMVVEITEASRNQLEGIQQANSAVTNMDSITQQNAALVEEATAASAEMVNSVDKMRKDLQFFRIR